MTAQSTTHEFHLPAGRRDISQRMADVKMFFLGVVARITDQLQGNSTIWEIQVPHGMNWQEIQLWLLTGQQPKDQPRRILL